MPANKQDRCAGFSVLIYIFAKYVLPEDEDEDEQEEASDKARQAASIQIREEENATPATAKSSAFPDTLSSLLPQFVFPDLQDFQSAVSSSLGKLKPIFGREEQGERKIATDSEAKQQIESSSSKSDQTSTALTSAPEDQASKVTHLPCC